MLHCIKAYRAELNGLLHGRMQVRKVEAFQQAQNLHERDAFLKGAVVGGVVVGVTAAIVNANNDD